MTMEKKLLIALFLWTALLMPGPASGLAGEAGQASFATDAAVSQGTVRVRRTTADESRRFDLGPGQGVTIIRLDPGDPLALVGFEVGDVILEVNGEVVEGLKNFVELFNSPDHDKPVTLLGVDHRSGRRGYVQILVP